MIIHGRRGFWSVCVVDYGRYESGLNGFFCLEVRHGIRFSAFGHSIWIFSLLIKGGMLRICFFAGACEFF